MNWYRIKSYRKNGDIEFVNLVCYDVLGALSEAYFCVQEYDDAEMIDLYDGARKIATLYK